MFGNRAQQLTTTTGTGTLSLGTVTPGRQSLVSAAGDGAQVLYVLEDANGTGWEIGLGTLTAGSPDTLSRDTIRESTNSDAAISLSSGSHRVTIAPDATWFVDLEQQVRGASIQPTLDLEFAAGRYRKVGNEGLTEDTLANIVTFTRSSTATRFNALGVLESMGTDVPRIDYDPVTGECLGLLIEESRTNELTQSEAFDNADWTKDNATISADAETAPDDTTTADKLVEDSSASTHGARQDLTGDQTLAWAFSIYAKKAERTSVKVELGAFGDANAEVIAFFDLANGTVTSEQIGSNTSGGGSSIEDVGDGFYRCSVFCTQLNSADDGNIRSGIYIVDGNGNDSYTGDGSSGLYIWGAQLEQGSFPTSYIPTTTAAVTRSADSASVPTSGWYQDAEGTMFAEFDALGVDQDAGNFILTRGSNGRFFYRNTGASEDTINTFDGTNSTGTTSPSNPLEKAACSWGDSGLKLTVDAEAVSDTSYDGDMGSGDLILGEQHFSGHFKHVRAFARQLADSELVEVTR